MRSYSGLLIFETLFDSIPSGNPSLSSLEREVFSPLVPVVAEDCGTTLGSVVEVNYELAGRVELATDEIIFLDRINELLSAGKYEVSVRDSSSCIAPGGICRKCYAASRPLFDIPELNRNVEIRPYYIREAEAFFIGEGATELELSLPPEFYDDIAIYDEEKLLSPSEYTIEDTSLKFHTPYEESTHITVRYYVYSRSPFLNWLGGTYSGAMLGIKTLPGRPLPIRPSLLTRLIPESNLEYLAANSLSSNIPEEMLEYLPKIGSRLEKSLYLIALHSIYNSTVS